MKNMKLLILSALVIFCEDVFGMNSADGAVNTQKRNNCFVNQRISEIIKNENENRIINELNRLIKSGMNINEQDEKGRSHLFYALAKGKEEVAKYLIKNGADKDEQFRNGYSPLIYAIFKGKPDFLNFLLNSGVNINKKNTYDCTPLCLVKAEILSLRMQSTVKDERDDAEDYVNYANESAQYYLNIEKILLEHGAKINYEVTGEAEDKYSRIFKKDRDISNSKNNDIKAFGEFMGWQKLAEKCKRLGIPLYKIF